MYCCSPIEHTGSVYNNRIFVKRDDKLPFSYGGNKVRFAEAFVKDMQSQGKNAMIAYGSKSSNLCRVLAQMCCDKDIPCAVVYSEDEHTDTNNSRIVSSLGVREYACAKTEVANTVQKAIEDFEAQGMNPYYIYGSTLGTGNELTPVSAYTKVYDEISEYESEQSITFDYIFMAVGTAASYSGILARAEELSHKRNITGISVARPGSRCTEIISENLKLYLKREVTDPQIEVCDEYLEGGYGKASEEELREIDFIYENFGLPLDPTYTGKAWFGMKNYLAEKGIKNKNILFIHTGGYPLFCDYKDIKL